MLYSLSPYNYRTIVDISASTTDDARKELRKKERKAYHTDAAASSPAASPSAHWGDARAVKGEGTTCKHHLSVIFLLFPLSKDADGERVAVVVLAVAPNPPPSISGAEMQKLLMVMLMSSNSVLCTFIISFTGTHINT